MTMTHYVIEIDRILDKMFAVKPHVLPANRRSVELYLDQIWSPITALTTGFRRADRNDVLEERFQSYVLAEEDRLRDALERVRYDIDAPDTLQLITGPGRIEKVRCASVDILCMLAHHGAPSISSLYYTCFLSVTMRLCDSLGQSSFIKTNYGIQQTP